MCFAPVSFLIGDCLRALFNLWRLLSCAIQSATFLFPASVSRVESSIVGDLPDLFTISNALLKITLSETKDTNYVNDD